MYKPSDISKPSSMVFVERSGLLNLYQMVKYCEEHIKCRRCVISEYFGEQFDSVQCRDGCDNCKRKQNVPELDVTQEVVFLLSQMKKFISLLFLFLISYFLFFFFLFCFLLFFFLFSYFLFLFLLFFFLFFSFLFPDNLTLKHNRVATVDQKLTFNQLLDVWRGVGKSIAGVEKDKSVSKKYSKEVCEHIIANLLCKGMLKEEFHHTPYSVISYIKANPLMLVPFFSFLFLFFFLVFVFFLFFVFLHNK